MTRLDRIKRQNEKVKTDSEVAMEIAHNCHTDIPYLLKFIESQALEIEVLRDGCFWNAGKQAFGKADFIAREREKLK